MIIKKILKGQKRKYFLVLNKDLPDCFQIKLEKDAELDLLILCEGKSNEIINKEIKICHEGANSKSRTKVMSVARNNSQIDIKETLVVKKRAVGAEALLDQKAFVLSSSASINFVPSMEVETSLSEVKHSTLFFNPLEEQLFYIQNRGLSEKQVNKLYISRFLKFPSSYISLV